MTQVPPEHCHYKTITSPKNKQRLDLLLLDKGLVSTRTKAQALILSGQVRVDGQVVTKVGSVIPLTKKIELVEGPAFVSRGGEKLAGALKDFSIEVQDQVCMDVGSSTGGFTDCLLKNGAKQVVAIDVGKGQLDYSLRKDARVIVKEETHILSVGQNDLETKPTLVTIDVSFISLTKIFSHIKTLLADQAHVLAMVKPQFEVGAKFLKKGVVQSEEVQKEAVQKVIDHAKEIGFRFIAQSPAKIKGPKGNQEYFIHLSV